MVNKSDSLQNSKRAVLIQARMSSVRFHGKMLEKIGNVPLIEYVYKRCLHSKNADVVAVLTSNEKGDDELYSYCQKEQIPVFRGSLNNVLHRYVEGAKQYGCEIVCRVCGDSPFVDIKKIDEMFELLVNEGLDYIRFESRVGGFLSEVVTLSALVKVLNATKQKEDLEHVTRYILNNNHEFSSKTIGAELHNNLKKSLEGIHLTIDYKSDLELANCIINKGLRDFEFSSSDVMGIIDRDIDLDKYRRHKE